MSKKTNKIISFIYMFIAIVGFIYLINAYNYFKNPVILSLNITASTTSFLSFLVGFLYIADIVMGIISIALFIISFKNSSIVKIGYGIACLVFILPLGFSPIIFLVSSIILLIGNKKFVSEENTNIKNSTDWFYKQQ